MIEKVTGFDWDVGNIDKCKKHGLSVAVIEAFFRSEIQILVDESHSEAEERFIAVGKLQDGRGVFVGFTIRDGRSGQLIRPITVRFMHKREIQKYEKVSTKIQE
jgi:uncharacterized DUF497 family protein